MLQQDFNADRHQNDTARDFCPGFVSGSEYISHLHSESGEKERDDSDKTYRGQDVNLQKSEGNPYGQCVYAGGDCQQKHGFDMKRSVKRFLVFRQGLFYHGQTDNSQETKSDPMVYGGDILLKTATQQISDQRHKRLKASKPQTYEKAHPVCDFFHGKTLADRYGKGVHGQTDSK